MKIVRSYVRKSRRGRRHRVRSHKRRREKFSVTVATLFKTKLSAKKFAKRLRNKGHRAIVEKSSEMTRKRSPHLKWVVFRGQRRR